MTVVFMDVDRQWGPLSISLPWVDRVLRCLSHPCPLSTVGLPKGPPAVCICQLWVDSQPAGDCTTSGPCHLTAALPGNSWLTSHGSVAELLLKTSLCPPFCRGISSRTRHGAVGPRYTLVKKKTPRSKAFIGMFGCRQCV